MASLDPAVLRQFHQERSARLVAATKDNILEAMWPHLPGDPDILTMVRDALHELALIFRAEATKLTTPNDKGALTKGAKGTADSLRDCATRLMGVVEGMKNHGLPEQLSAPSQSTVDFIHADGPVEVVTDMQTGQQRTEPAASPILVEQYLRGETDQIPSLGATQYMNSNGALAAVQDAQAAFSVTWNGPSPAEIMGDAFSPVLQAVIHEPAIDALHRREMDEAATMPDNPFSGGETKSWSERHMPALTVLNLEDNPLTWNPAPGHTSPSQANMAAECGMKWWLVKRRGAPQRPSWANIGGSALHTFIEHIERGRFGPPDEFAPPPEFVRATFSAYIDNEMGMLQDSPFPQGTWHASKSGKEDRTWWENDGPEMVHRFLEWRKGWRAAGWEHLYASDTQLPVIERELFINGTKVVIDSAWINVNTHDIAIVDWKSGSAKQADYFQPTTYAIALMEAGLLPADMRYILGAFWDARSGALGPFADLKERHSVAEVKMRLSAPQRLDSAMIYMPNVNSGYGGCGSCSVRLSCPVGSRQGKGELKLEDLTTQQQAN